MGKHERFARALDVRRDPDGDSEFRAELEVVDTLRKVGADDGAGADATTRSRIAHKITAPAPGRGERPSPPGRARGRGHVRPVLAAAFCLLIGLGGLAVVLSGSALPGDPLYQVKRAREAVVLRLTFDEQDRALQRLAYAAGRLNELRALAEQGTRGENYALALADFRDSTGAAAATITTIATGTGGSQLETLGAWAAEQRDKLAALTSELPGTIRQDSALDLLERIQRRAGALHDRFDCYQITSGRSDELGVLPATGRCRSGPRTVGDGPTGSPAPSALEPLPAPRTPAISEVPRTPAVERMVPLATTRTSTSPQPSVSLETIVPVPAPPPAPWPRLPNGTPRPAPVLSIPPLLPGLLPSVG